MSNLSKVFESAAKGISYKQPAIPDLFLFEPGSSTNSKPSSSEKPSNDGKDVLSEEDRAWMCQISLSSRRQAVNIAALLAYAIDKKRISEGGVTIGIEGGLRTGKTLICDVIAHELIDGLNGYKPPSRDCMFLEYAPDQAFNGPAATKEFSIAGVKGSVSFKSFHSVSESAARSMRQESSVALVSFNHGFGAVKSTTEECSFSLFIKLTKTSHETWNSRWTIYVAPELRTPKMKQILDHLRVIDDRLKSKQTRENRIPS